MAWTERWVVRALEGLMYGRPPDNMSRELYRAAQSGDWEAIRRLPEYKVYKKTTANGNNILHVLAQAGDSSADAVKQILAEKPSLAFMKNGDKETPLVIASRRGHSEVVRKLIASRTTGHLSRMGFLDMSSATAVLEAVRFNRPDVVKLFLEQMPQLFQKKSVDHMEIFLLQSIVEVVFRARLTKKKNVESPLYLAVEKGHNDIVSMIMSSSCKSIACHGPDENLTAFHVATIRNSPESIKMISNNIPLTYLMGIDGWSPLHYAAKLNYFEIVKLLLFLDESMGYVVARNDECKTALHIAVINGHLDVMQEIMEQCPQSWEMVTDKKQNILHLAIENEHKQVLEWILQCSWASELINKVDADGNTPLHLYATTTNLEVYNLVTHPCVDRNAINKRGMTPMDLVETSNFTATSISIRDDLKRAGATSGFWRINPKSETSHGGNESENANTYMVVATLILTMAFAAGFTIPGGYDTAKENEGMAILGRKAAFIVFVVSDSLAMLLSIAVVHLQLLHKDNRLISDKLPVLWIFYDKDLFSLQCRTKVYITYAMACLVMAFISGLYTIMPVSAIKIFLLVIGSLFFLPIAQYTLFAFMEYLVHSRQ